MDIKGKINLFVEVKKLKDEKSIKVFTGNIGHKNEDGSYTNASIGIRFSKDNFPYEKLNQLEEKYCYVLDVTKGFLSVRGYVTKEGKAGREIYLEVLEGTILDKKEITKDASLQHIEHNNGLPF